MSNQNNLTSESSLSEERYRKLEETIEASCSRGLRGNGGEIIFPSDLWSEISPELLVMSEEGGDGLWDAVLASLQRLLTSPIPQSASFALRALRHADAGGSPKDFLRGHRRPFWADTERFLEPTLTEQELSAVKMILSAGGLEGYELQRSEIVSEPSLSRDPMKFIPIQPASGWIQTSDVDGPVDLTAARFVVADESVFEQDQVDFLINLSQNKTPVVLFCWRIDENLAQDLGRGWRDGWSRVIPCAAEEAPLSQEVRMNILADTAWIVGSMLCNYVSKVGLRELTLDSPGISDPHPGISILSTGIRLAAFSTKSACRTRAAQLLSRIDGEDEHKQLLAQRANYIHGVEAQLFLPDEWNDDLRPGAIDLGVSAYRSFVDSGTVEWGLEGEETLPVPFSAAVMAVKQAEALVPMLNCLSLKYSP